MKTEYTTPELQFVGAAEEVVLGSLGAGADLSNEYLPHDAEFASDDEPPAIA
jgi:hypothetical protein